ncbi:peptidase S8, partial [Streptococcus mutans]|nr:peptidase S8 [Streptococcus mutans]
GNYDYADGTSISTGKVSGELAEIISNYHLQGDSSKARSILLNQVNYTSDGYKEISTYKALRGY